MSLKDNNDKFVKIIGIDPSIVSLGFSVIQGHSKCNDFVYTAGGVFEVPSDLDLASRYRRIRYFIETLCEIYNPDMFVIEDVDFRPFIKRQVQSYLFGSFAVILSAIPSYIGYYAIRKQKVNTILGLIEKGKKKSSKQIKQSVIKRYEKYLRGIKDKNKEHVADSIAVVEAFLRESDVGSLQV